MNFNKTIYENRLELGRPFLVAHRGVCGANIPCNSIAAYKAALLQGADVIEIDVAKSKDGKFFVFHPGMEHVFLKSKPISEMKASEVRKLRLLNQDSTPTSYKVPTLQEVLKLLKGKVYINVDKFWTDIEGIANEIYKAGVEKQVIVKTGDDKPTLDKVKKYAPEFMFIPIVWHKDTVTQKLIKEGVNVIGVEILFDSDEDDCISEKYIKKMHKNKLLIWTNAIIYDERAVISAHHTDDISAAGEPEKGWGWLIDKNVDFIQTDWLLMLKQYMATR